MAPALETTRLFLRPLEIGDAAAVQILFPHWEIVRYMHTNVPWPYPPDGAHRFYSDVVLPAVARGEQWHWTLRMRTDPSRLIGGISLQKGGDDNRGFWIGLPWQGQGLMTEACNAVTHFWFEVLKFPLLRTSKAIANTASRRISKSHGMRVVATTERDYVSGRLPAEIWEITAEEWRSRNATASRRHDP